MRLMVFFLLITILQVSAKSFSQKVSLDLKNVSLERVFDEITRQTGYGFFYQDHILDKAGKVSIKTKDLPLIETLQKCLEKQNLQFNVIDQTITVFLAKASPVETKLTPVDIEITGTVISAATKEPLQGASVKLKGASRGTSTDSQGKFSISVPEKGATLVISYISYTPTEVLVNKNNPVLNISLVRDESQSDEVVIIGYGAQKKSDLTGSVSSVKGDDLRQLTTQRVDQALQGRAAGVTVKNTDGAPGGNTTIRIRGSGSLTGSNNALIVIDGLQGGDLKSLNPNDIESIEVLKDASAAAIYGAQGANGVVLITTKKGRSGKAVINYSYNGGIQKLTRKLEVMNAGEFARAANEFTGTLDVSGPANLPFTAEEVANFEKNGGTDWQDQVYKTGALNNHQLSFSGGTDHLNYFISGAYMDNKGIMINTNYKRYSLRANVNADITSWASAGINWSGTKEAANVPPFGNGTGSGVVLGQATNGAYQWDATTPVYDASGNYMAHEPGYGPDETANPVLSARETFNQNNTIRNNISGYVEIKPLAGLSLKITGGAIISNMNNLKYLNKKTFEGAGVNGMGEMNTATNARYQNSNILTYNRDFSSKHHLTLTGVAEAQVENNQFYNIAADGFVSDPTGIYDLASAKNVRASANNITKRVLNSYLGRANYTFNGRYALTASYRADGSSVFGANNKWGYFPSLAAAWTASNEPFIKDLNLFSALKFRASWGILGNQGVNPYETISILAPGANYPYDGNGSTNTGYIASKAPNENLKWESTEQINVGLDAGLFRGRMQITLDVYKKTTRDLLLARQIPWYTGYNINSVLQNVGSMENKGIEISLGGDPLVGDFKWNTSVNFFANKSKILDLGAGIKELVQKASQGGGYGFNDMAWLIKGEPLGILKGHIYEGVWKTSEEAEANKFGQMPGDPRYKDMNGDYKINAADLTIMGRTAPRFSFGWNNRFSYKNFEFSASIQGVKGNKIFNAGRIMTEKTDWGLLTGTSKRLLDHWTATNEDTDVPGWIPESYRNQYQIDHNLPASSVSVNGRISRYIEDGSYVRLKSVNLGYNLTESVCRKLKMSGIRIYLSGANLLTITNYKGFDPEVSSFQLNDGQMGIDASNYPQSKTYLVGIDVTF